MSSTIFTFLKNFAISAADPVQLGFTQELEDQLVGQAHDLGAAVAEAPVDTVLVRAGGGGDGHLSALDGDGVAAAVGGGDENGLVLAQAYGLHRLAAAEDPHLGCRLSGPQKQQAQPQAQGKHPYQQGNPGFGFHGNPPCAVFGRIHRGIREQYSKFVRKTQEKSGNSS